MTLSFASIAVFTEIPWRCEVCHRPRDGLQVSVRCCPSAGGAVRVDCHHPTPRDGEEWVLVTQTRVRTWPLPSC